MIKLNQQTFGREFIVNKGQWLEQIVVAPLLGGFLKSGKTTGLAKPIVQSSFPDPQNYLAAKILDSRVLRPGQDQQMEWMQLSLRYLKVHQVLSEYDGDIKLEDTDLIAAALKELKVKDSAPYMPLTSLYDSAKTGGKRNGKLDVLEFFNLWSDITYYEAINDNLHQLLLPGLFYATPSLEDRLYTLDHLLAVYPSVGKDLFLKDIPQDMSQLSQSLRWPMWEDAFKRNNYIAESRIKRTLTPETFLKFLITVRMIESIYMIYDNEGGKADGAMTIKETQKFLDLFGLGTAQAARVFFINSNELAKTKGLTPDQIEDLIRGKKCPKSLRAHEFYERMKNLDL